VTVYVPPGYDEHDLRYPVLYMQDGQNLFEPDRAFVRGQHWRLKEAADAAIGARTAEPMIIVGIDNAGDKRIDEYGKGADDYGRLLLEEVKPVVEQRYRTNGVNAIGGSSLGGLVSLYLALEHPDVFSHAAVMSPSVWWNDRAILRDVDAFDGPRLQLWVDIGGREGAEAISGAKALRDRLLANGWNDENFRFHEEPRADHTERAWASRVRKVLEFLFPPA
jgi:predicted alpha/beta superfamily hydrolase